MAENEAMSLAMDWVGSPDATVLAVELIGDEEWVVTLAGRLRLHQSGPHLRRSRRPTGHRWVRLTFDAKNRDRTVPIRVEAREPYYDD